MYVFTVSKRKNSNAMAILDTELEKPWVEET